ncbi:hypothetical protein BY996DRAFT_8485052 [Phakopsora pachyrhizi]|nr:hypothetical protein BY996DRAFT_8485052 [Phakopsora pachyrhizi]
MLDNVLNTFLSPPVPQPPLVFNSAITIQEAQAKAKLIAAKLAALNGASSNSSVIKAPFVPDQQLSESLSSVPFPTTESSSKASGQPEFACRLMDKYGWKEGQGLGANEPGQTSILTVATANQVGGGKKQKENPATVGAGLMPANKSVLMGKGRGVVLDEAKVQRDLEERQRYGKPTRIVYLTNVVYYHYLPH